MTFGTIAPRTAPPVAPPTTSSAGGAVRVLAITGAVFIFLVGFVVSLTTIVFALAGIGVGALVWRMRGRVLGAVNAFLFSAGSVSLVYALLVVALFVIAGDDILNAQQAAANEDVPVPAWLERMSSREGSSAAPGAEWVDRMAESTAFNVWVTALTMTFACLFFGALTGGAAWLIVMLFGFGALGRWPWSRATVANPDQFAPPLR